MRRASSHSRAVAHRFAFSRSNKVSDEDTLREVPAAVPVSTAVKKLIGRDAHAALYQTFLLLWVSPVSCVSSSHAAKARLRIFD
jgi:hypothetical protein